MRERVTTSCQGTMPLAEDLLAVVDVLDEAVERAHALRQPALDDRPLVGRQDARHEVERERPVAAGAAVGPGGVEGDALLDEDGVAPLARGPEPLAAQAAEHGGQCRGGSARHARPSKSSSKKPGAGT